MKLKVGDKVKVMVGKDKGKEGTITHTFKNENKPNNNNTTGGIIETEAKIDASNVMIIDNKTNKVTRIYHELDSKTNKKVRVSKAHNKLD